jgi:hypothetical protein
MEFRVGNFTAVVDEGDGIGALGRMKRDKIRGQHEADRLFQSAFGRARANPSWTHAIPADIFRFPFCGALIGEVL